jgi:uncharacterized damage-inducible protein DinB
MQPDTPEVWLRGPLEGVPPLLQPVGHALLQAREEVNEIMAGFPEKLLWERPAGVASAGFHLQHLTGVLDRLFTYANGIPLTTEQLEYLQSEKYPPTTSYSVQELVDDFNKQVDKALKQLRETPEQSLLQPVGVGRKKLPSTVLGLLFHAAEHTQRHTGQLLVTTRVLRTPDQQ